MCLPVIFMPALVKCLFKALSHFLIVFFFLILSFKCLFFSDTSLLSGILFVDNFFLSSAFFFQRLDGGFKEQKFSPWWSPMYQFVLLWVVYSKVEKFFSYTSFYNFRFYILNKFLNSVRYGFKKFLSTWISSCSSNIYWQYSPFFTHLFLFL